MSKFFVFEPLGDGMDMPQAEYDKRYKAKALKCGHIPFNIEKKKFIVPVKALDLSLAHNFVGAVGTFLRNDLFEVLEPFLLADYDFGRIKLNQGTVRAGVLLWEQREAIPIRGNKESFCWRCKFCGVLRYQSSWRGEYLLKNDVQGMVFGPAGNTTIVNEDVVKVLTSHPQWKVFKRKTKLKEIPILDEPKDGFPMNLEDILPKDERRPAWCTKW